jgi:hypothetical protein
LAVVITIPFGVVGAFATLLLSQPGCFGILPFFEDGGEISPGERRIRLDPGGVGDLLPLDKIPAPRLSTFVASVLSIYRHRELNTVQIWCIFSWIGARVHAWTESVL